MNTLETVLCHWGDFGLPLAVEDVVPQNLVYGSSPFSLPYGKMLLGEILQVQPALTRVRSKCDGQSILV